MVFSHDIGFNLERIITDLFANSLKKETISNMETFIKALFNRLSDLLNMGQIPKLLEQALIGNTEIDLRRRRMGCDQYCPMCHK
jgi:hypothetical protein